MTYELAKSLKDAGFPQDKGLLKANDYGSFRCEGKGSVYLDGELHENHGAFRDEVWTSYEKFKEAIYVPTLEELIEACGDVQFNLRRADLLGVEHWETCILGNTRDEIIAEAQGSTPKEAVANLYLELNKKIVHCGECLGVIAEQSYAIPEGWSICKCPK